MGGSELQRVGAEKERERRPRDDLMFGNDKECGVGGSESTGGDARFDKVSDVWRGKAI